MLGTNYKAQWAKSKNLASNFCLKPLGKQFIQSKSF